MQLSFLSDYSSKLYLLDQLYSEFQLEGLEAAAGSNVSLNDEVPKL